MVFAAIAIFAGWWAYQHYEIKKRDPLTLESLPVPNKPHLTGWIEVARDEKGGIWSANADSVFGPRNSRSVWTMVDARTDKKRKTSWAMTRELYQINCETGGLRKLALVAYDAKELVVFHENQPDAKPEYFPPGSYGAHWSEFACDQIFDNKVGEPSSAIAPT